MNVGSRPLWADPNRLLPWICLVAVVGRLAAVAITFPPADGDRLWQLWLGERIIHEHAIPRALGPETFAAPGAPWVPQEWLFATGLALGADHGAPWLIPLMCALVVGLAVVMVVLRCKRRGLSGPITSAAVMFCALATVQSFGARAQVIGWAGLATTFWLLESDGSLAWALVPVTVLWANLHASVFLAPAVALVFALSALLRDRRWSRDAARYASIALACFVATLMTPLGFDLPRYAVGLLTSPIRESITEWHATSFDSVAFALGAFPLLLALSAFGVRSSLRDRIVALTFTVMLFAALRNVPLYAFAISPIALAALPLGEARNASLHRLEHFAAWASAGAAAILALVVPALSWHAAPAADTTLPLGPAKALLAQARLTPRVFCEDFAWCSIFLGASRHATFFMDGRADPYPTEIWREYRTVIDGNPGWAQILDARRVDTVLVRRDSPLDSLLAERSQTWHAITADAQSRMYIRCRALADTLDPCARVIGSKGQ